MASNAGLVTCLKLASLVKPQQLQQGETEVYSTPVVYLERSSELLCLQNFVLPVSNANPHEHSVKKLALQLNFVDQPPQEQTSTFYKVPDCNILIYCVPNEQAQAVERKDCEAILEWVRLKHAKIKDWLLLFAFEIPSLADFDSRRLTRRFQSLRQSLFRQNADFIPQEKRDRCVHKLLIAADSQLGFDLNADRPFADHAITLQRRAPFPPPSAPLSQVI